MDSIKEINIKDLFSNKHDDKYIIPIYQRNYAWEKEQIQELIKDIFDNNNEDYYLGTLIVNKIQNNLFEVVDGQQRLTTLFLLLKALKFNIDAFYLEFEVRDISNKVLSNLDNENFNNDKKNEISKGYKNVKDILEELKSDLSEDISLEEFNEKLKLKLNKIKLLRVQVPEHVDLNHYFEIMNTRGEQLELHEIAKNKFIETIADKKEQNAFSKIWDACSNMDKYVQMNFSKSEREKLFTEKWNNFNCKNFNEIADSLNFEQTNEGVELYDILNKSEHQIDRLIKQKFADIVTTNKTDDDVDYDRKGYDSIITFPNFLLQVNLILKTETGEEDSKKLDDRELLTNLKDFYSDSDKAKNFIYNLLKYRYYFDKYIIKRDYTQNKEGIWSLKKLKQYGTEKKTAKPINLCKLYEDENEDNNDNYSDIDKQLLMLESCCRITYTSPKTMYWIAEVLRNISKNISNEYNNETEVSKTLINILEKYCINKLKEAKKDNSEHPFGKGFDIPRIVFTYLDYLLFKNDKDKYKDFDFKFRNSIEHFYPQNPPNPKPEFTDKNVLHNFGNLALITVSGNSQVSNFEPDTKLKEWKDVMLQSIKLQKMRDIVIDSNGDWTKDLVIEHNKEMIDILISAMKD